MEILKYCKLHICLLLILLFISYLFVRDGNRLNKKTKQANCNHSFDRLFVLGELALLFDGVTVYTVNHLDTIPASVNLICHLAYLLCYQAFSLTHFKYWLRETDGMPKTLGRKILYYAPAAVAALVTVIFIPELYYKHGEYTNYSAGRPAIASFASIAIYNILTLVIFWSRKRYIQKNKRTAFAISLSAVFSITLIQIFFNETLVSSIGVILVILSIYLCMENPSVKFLELYHNEMIMGFSTLVESKDGSTGGHIRRTSGYAVLLAEELRKMPKYSKYITKDYIQNLQKAAPMHDIGKIGIPDSILQKPGKLTDEEFALMKKHPELGAQIISDTFGHLDDDRYESMTHMVALSHHEKWNGKGYPQGLSGTDIPLCARIMAVADVFDAVSSKRCYRDALPLEECYRIISDGRGTDFDPEVVDVFFASRKRVEDIYNAGA